MKKRNVAVLISCAVLSVVAAWSHFATAGIEDPPVCGTFAAGMVDEIPGGVAGGPVIGPGLNLEIGFEGVEGYIPGYISNAGGTPVGCGGVAFPCWGHTTGVGFSLITPSIEASHPASGVQHLRLMHDPTTRTNTTGFGLGIDARYPRTADLQQQPVARSTISADIAISETGGMDYRIQPQSNSQGCIQSSTLFFYTGAIYVLDDFCGTVALAFQPTGIDWDSTGAYQNFMTQMNPFENTLDYYYGGNLIWASCPYFGSNVEQFLVFGDNFEGSHMDVDNVIVSTYPPVCGDGLLEEECEPTDDSNCPGRCVPPGQPGECTCTSICTLDGPCPVQNGDNGPFISSGGFYEYSGTSPYVSVDACGSDFDGFLTLKTNTTTLITNANCQQLGGSNGANSDPTAPCYVQSGSEPDPCTCVANPNEPILISLLRSSSTPALGSTSYVNIRKKSACAGASVGACCDSNAHDGDPSGCTDNVVEADCSGSFDTWTDQGKCMDLVCDCVSDCTSRECGDDGCGGSCGEPCDDGNACNGVETCNLKSRCVPGFSLFCDDGLFCNGLEICAPTTGCVPGTTPCAENETCDEDSDQCEPNVIPTVSQWGLVVLTIVLLVAGKVQFGRRRPAGR